MKKSCHIPPPFPYPPEISRPSCRSFSSKYTLHTGTYRCGSFLSSSTYSYVPFVYIRIRCFFNFFTRFSSFRQPNRRLRRKRTRRGEGSGGRGGKKRRNEGEKDGRKRKRKMKRKRGYSVQRTAYSVQSSIPIVINSISWAVL